jgi:hypothetical protein
MDIQVKKTDFVDGRFSIDYGTNKRATFIVVKESFFGNNTLGELDRVNILVESFDLEGNKISGSFSTSIIGVGDGLSGILSNDTSLLGGTLKYDNIEQCVIRLYEQ